MTETVPQVEADRIVSMMADQQTEFDKFRENVNARLATVERIARSRRSSSIFDMDFEKLAGMLFLVVLAGVVARILFGVLAAHLKAREHGDLQVSET